MLAFSLFAICLFSLSACSSNTGLDLSKEDFSFTFLGTTVSKSDSSTIIDGQVVYLFSDLNYRDLSKYDGSSSDYDIDQYGNIILNSFTYEGKYKMYANPVTETGNGRVELDPNKTNKVNASMGVDQYKKVMDFYVYADDSDTSWCYTIFVVFADSETL
jgi:hypothetical protein